MNSAITRKAGFLGVAACALVAFGVAGGPAPVAQPLSLEAPVRAAPSFADVVEAVKPAVVSVRVRLKQGEAAQVSDVQPNRPGAPNRPGQPPRRGGQGSGFFVSADGYLVTNNHVIAGAEKVEIVTDDGRTLAAKVVGTDSRTDLALVKVEENGPFPFVRLAGGEARVGDWVVAIGNPFGLGGTVTAGIVSAHGRDIGAGPYDEFIQIDAAVNRGNSGGPTFNLQGEVVGVNTAIYSPTGGSVGIGFAVPAHLASKVVAELREKGSVTRGFIGVQIQPVTPDVAEAIGLPAAKGALVAAAVKDGPAEKAGLKAGDAILAVDGRALDSPKDLTRRIADVPPGKAVTLKIWRDGGEREVRLEVARQTDA
jgi:serine protease Do